MTVRACPCRADAADQCPTRPSVDSTTSREAGRPGPGRPDPGALASGGRITMALQVREAPAEQVVELPEPWRSAAVTVVLPTYNEAANLPVIAAELLGLPLSGLRILVADDNSPDGTGDIADKLAGQYGPDKLTVVHRQE